MDGFRLYTCFILTVIAFWVMIGAGAIGFLAYEEWQFENQPPQIAGSLMVPAVPKGESY